MVSEKRVREIVREEIRLIEEKAKKEYNGYDYPLITPSWGMGEAFPKVKKKAKENPTRKE